ncbi:TRP-domain-containing protein [Auriscalpium vulgare]|uniref:TRP-domain-containing protein n=1 Tax=Auriscalpium vulgare TaxID=40419 RepID=A0ACB8RW67_9AGAM|nr:TRP-domain-containing protein [Auriscalpium vulgare]
MLFSVARLRLFLSALSLLPVVTAHQKTLFTSSVSYCAPPENLLVEQFDIAYFPANNSIVFNVTAASVQANVNVSANLFLNVYGLRPFNHTIDICTLFGGALCPLPLYNFSGHETLQLPSSVDITKHLPAIAFQIPDLEAFVQLTLTETSTGDLKACLQSTLSNGWSTHQPGVSWALAGLALVTLFSAIWQSFVPDSLAPARLLDLLGLYQLIASSGFFDLNYPVVYRAFAANFSWTMGLFSQSAQSSMQRSINSLRHHTGGRLADASQGGTTALVNRKLSPYSQPVSGGAAAFAIPPSLIASAKALPKVNLASLAARTASAVEAPSVRDVQTVTGSSSNLLEAGVPIYANTVGIATANAFMTAFFSALILLAVAAFVLAVSYGLIILATRRSQSRWLMAIKARFPIIAREWGLRIALICYFPLVTFALYEWTLKDSWLVIVISVITFLTIAGIVGYATFRILHHLRRSSPYLLPTDLPAMSPLFAHYRAPRYFYFAFPILALFLRAVLIAAGKNAGTAQIILVVIFEALLLAAYIVCRPGQTRRADVLGVFVGIVRVACAGLLIAYIEPINLAPIPRVAIGFVVLVVFSIAVIVMFLNALWNLGLEHVWRRRPFNALRSRSGSSTGDDQSALEKGANSEKSKSDVRVSAVAVDERPRNPTPTHNEEIDPAVRQTYPAFTPTTTIAEPSSAHSTDTSTSYGHQIQSRWRLATHTRSSSAADSTITRTPLSTSYGPSPVDDTRPPSPSQFGHSRQPTIEEERLSHP